MSCSIFRMRVMISKWTEIGATGWSVGKVPRKWLLFKLFLFYVRCAHGCFLSSLIEKKSSKKMEKARSIRLLRSKRDQNCFLERTMTKHSFCRFLISTTNCLFRKFQTWRLNWWRVKMKVIQTLDDDRLATLSMEISKMLRWSSGDAKIDSSINDFFFTKSRIASVLEIHANAITNECDNLELSSISSNRQCLSPDPRETRLVSFEIFCWRINLLTDSDTDSMERRTRRTLTLSDKTS